MSETNTNPEARVVEAVARVRARLGILADESHWPDYVDEARELIAAHTKALAAEGMVIVPREPTPEMVKVFLAHTRHPRMDYERQVGQAIQAANERGAFRCAATPTPTLPPAGDER